MAEEPRKRSRFDVGPSDAAEPPARRSRFDVSDRRSRSPGTPGADRTADRERTPIKNTEGSATPNTGDKGSDAAAKAAEAAARINAQLQSKKAIQHVDVPPIRQVSPMKHHALDTIILTVILTPLQSPSANPGVTMSPSDDPTPSGTLNAEIYQQDGDFIKDIEVNDLRNRYTLTKGSTQKMVNIYSVLLPTDTPRRSVVLAIAAPNHTNPRPTGLGLSYRNILRTSSTYTLAFPAADDTHD